MHAEVYRRDQDRVVATVHEYMSPGVMSCAVCHCCNYINKSMLVCAGAEWQDSDSLGCSGRSRRHSQASH